MKIQRQAIWVFGVLVALLMGCATPGAPLPPSLRLPQPVKDLQAVRKGDNVYLRWTVPTKTTDGALIRPNGLGKTRICRGYVTDGANSCRDVAADVETKADASGRQTVSDHIASLVGGNRDFLPYTIKVNNEDGKNAGPSNSVIVFVAPSIAAPPALNGKLEPNRISLEWDAHELPTSSTLRAEYFYRVKRSVKGAPESVLGEMPARPGRMRYDDGSFAWEQSYAYRVAGVTRVISRDGKTLSEFEGEDSPAAIVVTHDTFPPPVPSGLQAVYSSLENRGFIDLTWSPDIENDLAGYNIYRSESTVAAVKINAESIKVPAFRDSTVLPGKSYTYAVTAIDARGNESARSEAASEKVPE